MTILKVPAMHCQNCVNRITAALDAEEVNFSVSLPDKTVSIDGCEHCVETTVNRLEDLGFSSSIISQDP
jgi:copper chaperone